MRTNWAGNIAFRSAQSVAPASAEELCDVVRAARKAKAIGSAHSFSAIGDVDGTLISTEQLTAIELQPDGDVRVGAGVRYGDLVRALAGEGRAVANLASLPHITVGGAVATATHGSGVRNQSLASAVVELDLVLADGSVTRLRRGDPVFDGAVVSLGALGVVSALTLETLPAFDVAQWVFEDVEGPLAELLALGYSTSLFLTWAGDRIEQLWVKSTEAGRPAAPGTPATSARHPVAGADPSHCTEQLGVRGPAGERLAHFRFDGVPSAGNELQSEWAVAAADADEAFAILRGLGPSLAPLLHVSEIRAVAADGFWLSPFFERDSVAFHFTWKPLPDEVGPAIRRIEAALEHLDPRPHWAKLFSRSPAASYPRLGDFRALRSELDPTATFGNRFLAESLDEPVRGRRP